MLPKPSQNPAPMLLVSLFLLASLSACGNLQGAAGKNGASSRLSYSLSAGTAASIVSVYPAEGAIAAPPTTVNVNFSSGNLDSALLSAVSSYLINCGGLDLVAQGVTHVPGVASVAVALPTITGLTEGTVCTFKISSNLKDALGNFITGIHSVRYTINSGASATGGGWVPAAGVSFTSSVGSVSGNAFHAVGGPADSLLKGLMVNGTQYADGIVGVWTTRFSSSAEVYGQPHGATAGGYTQLSCPAGYRVTGFHGRSGTYIDALGIICKDESQGQTYRSPAAGGSGGNAFEYSCPAGQFATDLAGRAGSYLNQFSLGCR